MTTSDYSVILAIAVLLSGLWWTLRFVAREASRPRKDRRLRTRWDDDLEKMASISTRSAEPLTPDLPLKLPRRKREEPNQPPATPPSGTAPP